MKNTWNQINSVLPKKQNNEIPQKSQIIENLEPDTGGWKDTKGFTPVKNKEPETWNSNDVRWYFRNTYLEKYGVSKNFPAPAFNTAISQIMFSIYKVTNKECKKGIFKLYFDYFFSNCSDTLIKKYGIITLKMLTNEKLILQFVAYLDRNNISDTVENKKPNIVEKVNTSKCINIKDIDMAYAISSKNLLMQFGVVIALNYVLHKKNKPDASVYVEKAISKLSADEIDRVKTETDSWGPYPDWMQSVDSFNIKTCKDDSRFDILRSKHK